MEFELKQPHDMRKKKVCIATPNGRKRFKWRLSLFTSIQFSPLIWTFSRRFKELLRRIEFEPAGEIQYSLKFARVCEPEKNRKTDITIPNHGLNFNAYNVSHVLKKTIDSSQRQIFRPHILCLDAKKINCAMAKCRLSKGIFENEIRCISV